VVVRQTNDREFRQVAVLLALAELRQPPFDPRLVGDREVVPRKALVDVPDEAGDVGLGSNEVPVVVVDAEGELPVAPIGDARLLSGVPEVATTRAGGTVVLPDVAPTPSAVVRRLGLPGVVVGDHPDRPVVPVGTDFGVNVEVVEQHELLGERAVIRRQSLVEKRQRGFAVAPIEVAEDLVVGTFSLMT
jgi:hypothetical protein